ncbi:MAG: NYN domain-containing protein [Chloroflexi bacterium]|nr:NYN domain-containing protein [Chloroflexota bacterium]
MPDSVDSFKNKRIAMLIDGDNAQPSLMEEMIAEAGKYGLVTIRRIYGDWTTTNMNSWKDILNVHAVQPIQQFRYTTGKNATDSALIIDAMDILYTDAVQGFCLVASDSDYTRLATRIREKGFFVMGIGKKATPKAFVNACEVFVYTENLVSGAITSKDEKTAKESRILEPVPPDLLELLKNAIEMSLQDDGWAFLGTVGARLHQLDPGFDPRTYGKKQLSELIRQYKNTFQMKESKSKEGTSLIYVRLHQQP